MATKIHTLDGQLDRRTVPPTLMTVFFFITARKVNFPCKSSPQTNKNTATKTLLSHCRELDGFFRHGSIQFQNGCMVTSIRVLSMFISGRLILFSSRSQVHKSSTLYSRPSNLWNRILSSLISSFSSQ